MRISTGKKAPANIPTASMADIAFLLIIFFMVTTVHEVDRTSVNLPLSITRTEAEKGSAIVVLARDKFGELFYMFSDGKNMSHSVNGPPDRGAPRRRPSRPARCPSATSRGPWR